MVLGKSLGGFFGKYLATLSPARVDFGSSSVSVKSIRIFIIRFAIIMATNEGPKDSRYVNSCAVCYLQPSSAAVR